MPTQNPGSEELVDLAAYLRRHDFTISTTQVLAAQRLLWRMAEQGIAKPTEDLAPWLGPVFASSIRELDRFPDLFGEWQKAPLPPPPPPEPGPSKPRHPGWRRATVLVVALVSLLAIAGLWCHKSHRTIIASSGSPSAGPDVPTTRPPMPPAANSRDVPVPTEVSGFLSGDDGKPVAHARFLFRGNDSQESGADGSFTIAGTGRDPILAVSCDYDAVLFHFGSGTSLDLTMKRKAQPACGPGGTVPLQGVEESAARYRRWRISISLLPILVSLAWAGYVIWKRVGLKRWKGALSPRFAQIPLGDSAEAVFPESDLQRSVQELRRPHPIPVQFLWPTPTVAATVENAGWFTPVYRAHRRTPEYLVLIDRKGKRDQQARFAEELLDRFKSRGVDAHVYYFQSDARTCSKSESGSSISISLAELSARFGACEVWVVADGSSFFNALTGRLEQWVDLFQQWPTRVLLTPVAPAEWEDHELQLADVGFEILPASARGLARIAEHLAIPDLSLDYYPPMLDDTPARWVGNQSPSSREITRLSTELRLYLGRHGFQWLAACAEYPLIEWPLTLCLGNSLMPPGTIEAIMRKLIRLPWFRRGAMPRWLRDALVRKDKALRGRVKEILAKRLEAMPAASAKPTDELQILFERDYKRRIEEDEVWLSFLWGRTPGSLSLPASRLRRMLFQQGRIWLGPHPFALLAISVLSAGAIFWAMSPRHRALVSAQPEIERIALDVAVSQYHDPSYYRATIPEQSFPEWCYRITQLLLGRAVSFIAVTPGAPPIAGAIAVGKNEAGIFAGNSLSLVSQRGRIVAQNGLNPYQVAQFSTGPLPAPPSPPLDMAALPAINSIVVRPSSSWGLLFSADETLNPPSGGAPSAVWEIGQSAKFGFTKTSIYHHGGLFWTVINAADEESANTMLQKVRTTEKKYYDATVVNLQDWCPNAVSLGETGGSYSAIVYECDASGAISRDLKSFSVMYTAGVFQNGDEGLHYFQPLSPVLWRETFKGVSNNRYGLVSSDNVNGCSGGIFTKLDSTDGIQLFIPRASCDQQLYLSYRAGKSDWKTIGPVQIETQPGITPAEQKPLENISQPKSAAPVPVKEEPIKKGCRSLYGASLRIQTADGQPVSHAVVSIVGGETGTSADDGTTSLLASCSSRPGDLIAFQVSGWTIVSPTDGKAILPKARTEPIEITVSPIGQNTVANGSSTTATPDQNTQAPNQAPKPSPSTRSVLPKETNKINLPRWPSGANQIGGATRETPPIAAQTPGQGLTVPSPNGQEVAKAAQGDAAITVLDVDGRQVARLLEPSSEVVTSMAWNPSGTRLASGGNRGRILVWEIASQSVVVPLEPPTSAPIPIVALAWSPAGNLLASGDNRGAILIWNVTLGKDILVLSSPSSGLRSLAWSADGRQLTSIGRDGASRIWDATTGQEMTKTIPTE